MNNYEYKKIYPFRWFILENFPFIEEDFDALTNWQLFCKLGKEINKIIKSQNDLGTEMETVVDSFINLQNYVENYFANLDVQEEINNKLDAMVLDGTLSEIINQEIFGELNEKVNQNSSDIDLLKKFPSANIGLKRIFRFIEDSNYLSMQGGSITPNNTLVCALWDSSNDTNKIIEISLASGIISKQATYSFGWCNGLSVDTVGGKVYVAHRGKNGSHLKKVSILNYSDLSLVSTIDFSDYVMSVYFNKDTSKLYFLNEWDEKTTYGFKVYEINQTSFEIENTITIDFNQSDLNKLTIQNFAVVGDYIYLISSDPRGLIIVDMDGNLVKEYNLPEHINEIYYSGEYQFIDFINNEFYIGSIDAVLGIESINQVFKLKLDDEYINGETYEVGMRSGGSYECYVDSNSVSVNPDGSELNKFKSINEATRYFNPNRGTNINIADGTYHGVYLRSRNNIHFIGNSNLVVIKGFNIGYCTNISIDTATIENCEFTQSGVVNINKSIVYLKGLTINDTDARFGVNVSNFSICNFGVLMAINVNNTDHPELNQIFVRSDSLLILNQGYWHVEKHQKASKIIGETKIRAISSPTDMCIGDFNIDPTYKYCDFKFYTRFNYIVFRYKIGNDVYIHKAPLYSSSNKGYISYQNTSGTGTTKISQVYYEFSIQTHTENDETIYDSAQLQLKYSKVYTRDNTGAVTVQINDDNSNPVEDSIIVDDIYLE